MAAAQERPGDDRHRYEPQPLLECSEANGRTGIFIGDACLLVSGEARLALGYDSSAGLVGLHSELLSAMGVAASDFGPVFGVFTVRNEGDWPEDNFPFDQSGPSLYEAYLAAGEDIRLTVGKAPTLIETNDDRALDWVGADSGRGVFFPLENNGTYPLTATSLQLATSLSEQLSLAVAFEDGPMARNFWGPDDTDRRLVGVLAYDDGETTARLTVARFDDAEGWAGRLAVQTVIAESFRVLAVGSLGDGQTLDAMVSARVQVGTFEVAGTAHKIGGYYDEAVAWSGSVSHQVSPDVVIRGGAMVNDAEDDDDSRVIALGAVIAAWDNAALDLEVGAFDDEYTSGTYGKVSIDWHVNEMATAKLSAVAVTDGGYKVESELVTALR